MINCTASNNNFYGFLLDFPGEFNKIINSTAFDNDNDGISISNSVNNTILNCTLFSNSRYGLQIFSSEDNSVVNSTLSGNTNEGLYLRYGGLNRIINCSISSNTGHGVFLDDSDNNNLTNCTTSGNSFYGIYLKSSNSNDIENCTIFDNTNGGFVLETSNGNKIWNCTAWNNYNGYSLWDSDSNTFSNSTAWSNQVHGFYLNNYCRYNTFSYCTANANTFYGIMLQYGSNYNQILNSNSSNNQIGIYITDSCYNDITQTEISYNEYGFELTDGAYDNVIWNNQILNNTYHQALDDSGTNQWNQSNTGNYWSDYLERYPSAIDMGGYWSIPYSINGSAGAQDYYPLAINLFSPDSPTIITTNQTINNKSLTIDWTTVPDATSYNVYVNGIINATTSLTQQLIGLHTNGTYEITVTAMNSSGESNQSAAISIIVAIPPIFDGENPSWLESPENQEVEYGTSFIYNLNATDNVAIDEYWLDDIVNFQIDINGIITNISTLFPGYYNLEIFVNDTSNNTISSMIQISCVDNEAPKWIEIPQNQVVEYGAQFIYDVNASDNFAIGEYSLNNTTYFDIDQAGVITNATILIPGTYFLEITVIDTGNNQITYEISITVNPDPNSPERRKIPAYSVGFLTIWIIIAIGSVLKKSSRFQYNLST